MDSQKEKAILNHTVQARQLADAFIVVGFMPGGRFFYAVDDRITIPDLHGALRNRIDAICADVQRARQQKQGAGR